MDLEKYFAQIKKIEIWHDQNNVILNIKKSWDSNDKFYKS